MQTIEIKLEKIEIEAIRLYRPDVCAWLAGTARAQAHRSINRQFMEITGIRPEQKTMDEKKRVLAPLLCPEKNLPRKKSGTRTGKKQEIENDAQ